MIKLNSEVSTKKIGLPAVGRVAGIMLPDMVPPNPAWDLYYPDWKEKPIAYVKLNKPLRPVSKEEYFQNAPVDIQEMSEEDKDMFYQNNVPLTRVIPYPIEDLEEFS